MQRTYGGASRNADRNPIGPPAEQVQMAILLASMPSILLSSRTNAMRSSTSLAASYNLVSISVERWLNVTAINPDAVASCPQEVYSPQSLASLRNSDGPSPCTKITAGSRVSPS